MMRVMMPNGTVVAVEKAVAIAEKRPEFNGQTVRLSAPATDIAFANGVAFLSQAKVQDIAMGDAVFVGNLQNESVREVLATLVRQEYVDLSDLRLQKTQLLVSNYVVDDGISGAYIIKGLEAWSCANALGYPFMNGAVPTMGEATDTEDTEDAEDAGEEDEED